MNPVQAIPPASPAPRNRAKANVAANDSRFDMAMGHAAAVHARTHVSTTPPPEREQAPRERHAEEQAPIETIENRSREESGGSTPTPVRASDEQGEPKEGNAPKTQGQSPDPKADSDSFVGLLKPPVQSMPVRPSDLIVEAPRRGVRPQPVAPTTETEGRRVTPRPGTTPQPVTEATGDLVALSHRPDGTTDPSAAQRASAGSLEMLAAVAAGTERPLPQGLAVRVLASRITGANRAPELALVLPTMTGAAPAQGEPLSSPEGTPLLAGVRPDESPALPAGPPTEEVAASAPLRGRAIIPQPVTPPIAEAGPARALTPVPVMPATEETSAKPRIERQPIKPSAEESGGKSGAPVPVRMPVVPAPVESSPAAGSARAEAKTDASARQAQPNAPSATTAPAAATAGGGGGSSGSDAERGESQGRDSDPKPTAVHAAESSAPVTAIDSGDRGGLRVRAVDAGIAGLGESALRPTLNDPRLEPMRRVADRVTLRFEGEAGLEGRLRLAVRGETLHASLLSSHEGTLEKMGAEMGSLRQALRDQGFADPRLTITDTRTNVNAPSDAKNDARSGEERRQGEPSRQKQQGREERHGGQGSEGNSGRRSPRQGRQSS